MHTEHTYTDFTNVHSYVDPTVQNSQLSQNYGNFGKQKLSKFIAAASE